MRRAARWFVASWCVLLAVIAIGAARGAAILDLNGAKIVVMTQDELAALINLKDGEIAAARAERKRDCGII